MITIVVVDDQRLLREGLRLLLETTNLVRVVGEADSAERALPMIDDLEPDVVLADAKMPGLTGVHLVALLRESHPTLPVIILTTFDDDDLVRRAIAAGAAGFLLKDVSPEVLTEAVRAAHRGEVVIDPRVARAALGRTTPRTDPLETLTPAERAVAERIAQGRTNREIAADLTVAEGTVKNHVSTLLRKLQHRDRTGLALWLYRQLHVEARARPDRG